MSRLETSQKEGMATLHANQLTIFAHAANAFNKGTSSVHVHRANIELFDKLAESDIFEVKNSEGVDWVSLEVGDVSISIFKGNE